MIGTKIHTVVEYSNVIYDYLDCGNLHLGFACKCEDCNGHLLPFM